MDALIIEATEFTPAIIMDPETGQFELSGESRPENAGKFYQQVIDWLDKYYSLRYWRDRKFDNKSSDVVFEFKFEYFNSTSAKFLLDILKRLETFRKGNMGILIKWYYDKPDIDMKESGEEFAKMIEIPFELIET